MRGCTRLLEGEMETPLLRASTVIRNESGSANLSDDGVSLPLSGATRPRRSSCFGLVALSLP